LYVAAVHRARKFAANVVNFSAVFLTNFAQFSPLFHTIFLGEGAYIYKQKSTCAFVDC